MKNYTPGGYIFLVNVAVIFDMLFLRWKLSDKFPCCVKCIEPCAQPCKKLWDKCDDKKDKKHKKHEKKSVFDDESTLQQHAFPNYNNNTHENAFGKNTNAVGHYDNGSKMNFTEKPVVMPPSHEQHLADDRARQIIEKDKARKQQALASAIIRIADDQYRYMVDNGVLTSSDGKGIEYIESLKKLHKDKDYKFEVMINFEMTWRQFDANGDGRLNF